ncbi:hypothetical protein AGMMS50267_16540 [Spirochaetia bacterium]|nr:hypothetical protein AGMMS50267_16540 [Spirochaetia bacterium]
MIPDDTGLFLIDDDAASRAARLALIPPIRRAREYRLYTGDNRRLVDLWLYGGRAVLGHNPPGILRELKNTAGRGLFAPYPSLLEARLRKALTRLFPGYAFRLYATEAALRRALSRAGYAAAEPFPDPALSPETTPNAPPPLWRPFLDTQPRPKGVGPAGHGSPPDKPVTSSPPLSPNAASPVFIPVLPLPWPGAPHVDAPGSGGEY